MAKTNGKNSACQGLHFIQLDQSHPMTLCKSQFQQMIHHADISLH